MSSVCSTVVLPHTGSRGAVTEPQSLISFVPLAESHREHNATMMIEVDWLKCRIGVRWVHLAQLLFVGKELAQRCGELDLQFVEHLVRLHV